MKKIFLIGGGQTIKLHNIDKKIIEIINLKVPKLLFIPTASHDALGYVEEIKKQYEKLGCCVDSLLLLSENSLNIINDKIKWCDIIYIGGGDTEFMMEIWKKYYFDEILRKAYYDGKDIIGLSAGGISICHSGYSDYMENGKIKFSFVDGLDLIGLDHNPHREEENRNNFLNDYRSINGRCLSMDNYTLAYFEEGRLINAFSLNDNFQAEVVDSKNNELKINQITCEIL